VSQNVLIRTCPASESVLNSTPVYNVVGVVKNLFLRLETNLERCELERGQGRPREAVRLSKTLDAA